MCHFPQLHDRRYLTVKASLSPDSATASDTSASRPRESRPSRQKFVCTLVFQCWDSAASSWGWGEPRPLFSWPTDHWALMVLGPVSEEDRLLVYLDSSMWSSKAQDGSVIRIFIQSMEQD